MQAANRIQQLKTYYFATKLAEVNALIQKGHDVINLGVGSPDMEVNPQVEKALIQASQQKGSSRYQPYKGIPALRDAFAKWYQNTYQVTLNSNTQILPLIGSKEAVMHLHLAFCNPGDTVLVPNPGYPTYAASAKLLGLNIEYYDLDAKNQWQADLQKLENKLTENTKIMWVNYPHMPTGAKATIADFNRLVEFAKKHQLLLVNDNPYSLILNDSPISIHSNTVDYDEVIELNSLSKSHNMSGWRVGVATGSEENINHLLKVKSNFDSGMYKPIQMGAIEALSLDKSWSQQLNMVYAKRRQLIWDMLDVLGASYDLSAVGMFVWAQIPKSYQSGEEFSDELLYNYHIFVPPGMVFGSAGEKYIRFSLCEDEQTIQKAINRIKKQMK